MAKILMMAGSIIVVLSLLGFLVLLLKGRAVTQTSPVLMSLKALGIRPSEAEQRLCRQRVWVGNDTLLTPREQHFFRALLRHTSRKRWLLCPQVRVADIATLSPHIRPRSRTWWQLFRMASQWHCDVVIVDIHTFAIIGAVELEDASHLKKHRIRRDILLEEVLRQAGIPVRTVSQYKIMHDKVIIADGRNVEVGSFNYTRAADRFNSENVLVVWDEPVVAQRYLQHWQTRWEMGKDWSSSY